MATFPIKKIYTHAYYRSEDNPEFFVIMEKTKMYVFKNTEPEDPVPNSGCKVFGGRQWSFEPLLIFFNSKDVCSFADLQIKVAAMDEILKDPDVPNKDAISDIETKALRDTRGKFWNPPFS